MGRKRHHCQQDKAPHASHAGSVGDLIPDKNNERAMAARALPDLDPSGKILPVCPDMARRNNPETALALDIYRHPSILRFPYLRWGRYE